LTSLASTAARRLRGHLTPRRAEMIGDLAALVDMDSPSSDVGALNRVADWLEAWLRPIGQVESIPAPDGRRHLLVQTPGSASHSPLILCHYDTVWPLGTTEQWSFEQAGDTATGPGICDMKAGIVCARHALEGLRQLDVEHRARLLLSSDEEIGNPSSRRHIETLAADAAAALVLEPPLEGGQLKTARKGHGHATVTVRGRAAHAGLHPERGINAIEQIAELILQLRDPAGTPPGSTAVVGRVQGGGARNVVPEHAELELDLRAWSRADMAALIAKVDGLRPAHREAEIDVVAEVDRPPMERGPSTDALMEVYAAAARAIGLPVAEGASGGVSEGNLAQAVGAPVLDGLGVRGAGLHARDERVDLTHLVPQTAIIGAMIAALSRRG
jgi:glutamate carboxypeptidase